MFHIFITYFNDKLHDMTQEIVVTVYSYFMSTKCSLVQIQTIYSIRTYKIILLIQYQQIKPIIEPAQRLLDKLRLMLNSFFVESCDASYSIKVMRSLSIETRSICSIITIFPLYIILSVVTAASYTQIPGRNLSIQLIGQEDVNSTGIANDVCGKVHAGNIGVYHLSKEKEFQDWSVYNLSQFSTGNPFSTGTQMSIDDFYVSVEENQVLFLNVSSSTYFLYIITQNLQLIFVKNVSYFGNSPSQIAYNSRYIYSFFKGQNQTDYLTRIKINSNSNNNIKNFTFQTINGSIAFSSDFTVAVIWNAQSQIYIYEATNFTLLHIFNESIVSTLGTTDSISFNSNNDLIIIETDGFSSIKIVNLSDFTVISYIGYSNKIIATSFVFDQTFILVIGENENIIYDIASQKYINVTSSFISPSIAYSANSSTLFTCYQSTIYSYEMYASFINISLNQNTQPINNQYYTVINLTETQQIILDNTGATLEISGNVAQKIIFFAMSTPLTYFFLSFINFFNLCSQYILLNESIPQQIYYYLNQIYLNLNSSFFNMIGIDFDVPSLTANKVNHSRPLNYNISSDLISSNYINFIFFAVNILIYMLINAICYHFKHIKIVRKFFTQDKTQVITGQIIAILIPIVLPWIFYIFGTYSNLSTKINLAFQYIFFFVSIIFQAHYLLILLDKRRQQKLKAIYLRASSISLQKNIQRRQYSINNEKLITYEIIDKWNICFNNFIYPLLVLIENPVFFLITITLVCLFGLKIAFNRNKWKLNQIALASYPFLFHICFILFQICENQEILAYVQIICLFILLIGSFHHFLSLLACIFVSFYKNFSSKSSSNKIKPIGKKKDLNKLIRSHAFIESTNAVSQTGLVGRDKSEQTQKTIHRQMRFISSKHLSNIRIKSAKRVNGKQKLMFHIKSSQV